jgi:hypothetical protein
MTTGKIEVLYMVEGGIMKQQELSGLYVYICTPHV